MNLDQVLNTECPNIKKDGTVCGRTYPLAHAIMHNDTMNRNRKGYEQLYTPHNDEMCRPCQREKGLIA